MTSSDYNPYCALMVAGIDPDNIDESAMVDPAFDEEDVFF